MVARYSTLAAAGLDLPHAVALVPDGVAYEDWCRELGQSWLCDADLPTIEEGDAPPAVSA